MGRDADERASRDHRTVSTKKHKRSRHHSLSSYSSVESQSKRHARHKVKRSRTRSRSRSRRRKKRRKQRKHEKEESRRRNRRRSLSTASSKASHGRHRSRKRHKSSRSHRRHSTREASDTAAHRSSRRQQSRSSSRNSNNDATAEMIDKGENGKHEASSKAARVNSSENVKQSAAVQPEDGVRASATSSTVPEIAANNLGGRETGVGKTATSLAALPARKKPPGVLTSTKGSPATNLESKTIAAVKKKRLAKLAKLKAWKETQQKKQEAKLSAITMQPISKNAGRQARRTKLATSMFDRDTEKKSKLSFTLEKLTADTGLEENSDPGTNIPKKQVSSAPEVDPLDAFMSQIGERDRTGQSLEKSTRSTGLAMQHRVRKVGAVSYDQLMEELDTRSEVGDTEESSGAQAGTEQVTDDSFIASLKKASAEKDKIFKETELVPVAVSSTPAKATADLFENEDGGQAELITNFEKNYEPSALEKLREKLRRKNVPAIVHNTMFYLPFRKNFYRASTSLKALSADEMNLLRFQDGTKVRGKGIEAPISKWSETGLNSVVLEVLARNQWLKPFSIQKQSLPVIMSGRDVVGVAKTGSGKTLSFVLPMLRHVLDQVHFRSQFVSGEVELNGKDSVRRGASQFLKLLQAQQGASVEVLANATISLLKQHNARFAEVDSYISANLLRSVAASIQVQDTQVLEELTSDAVSSDDLVAALRFYRQIRGGLADRLRHHFPTDGPMALILAPSRELAKQIDDVVKKFTPSLKINSLCCAGGDDTLEQINRLVNKTGTSSIEVIIGTPGRVIDLLCLNRGNILNVCTVTYLVLDEADRMFDMGFAPQVDRILQNLRPDHQTVLFSATFPQNVEKLARKLLKYKPCEIVVGGRTKASSLINQRVDILENGKKMERLLQVLGAFFSENDDKSVLVFVNKQSTCDELFKNLTKYGYECFSLHGGHDQVDRDDTIQRFRAREKQLLIATSVAGRGLDVRELKLVVNYNCPNHLEDYIHRVGRTGRANTSGAAITFLTPEEEQYSPDLLKALKDSEQEVPEQLVEMADQFRQKIKAGNARFRRSGYVGNRGFTFRENEKSERDRETDVLKREQRKLLLGEEEVSSDEDNDGDKEKTGDQGESKAAEAEAEAGVTTKRKATKGGKQVTKKSAMDLARKLAAQFSVQPTGLTKSQRRNEQTNALEDLYLKVIPINDYPQQVRYKITHRNTLEPIAIQTDCVIQTRGRYVARGQRMEAGTQKLNLSLQAATEYSIFRADAMIKRLLDEETATAMAREAQGPGKFSMRF